MLPEQDEGEGKLHGNLFCKPTLPLMDIPFANLLALFDTIGNFRLEVFERLMLLLLLPVLNLQ